VTFRARLAISLTTLRVDSSMGSKLEGLLSRLCSALWMEMHLGQRGSRQVGLAQKLVMRCSGWYAQGTSQKNSGRRTYRLYIQIYPPLPMNDYTSSCKSTSCSLSSRWLSRISTRFTSDLLA
jgi:hypothetical protein